MLGSKSPELVAKSITSLIADGVPTRAICVYFFWLIEDKKAPLHLIEVACKKYSQYYFAGGEMRNKGTTAVDGILYDASPSEIYARLSHFYTHAVQEYVNAVLLETRKRDPFFFQRYPPSGVHGHSWRININHGGGAIEFERVYLTTINAAFQPVTIMCYMCGLEEFRLNKAIMHGGNAIPYKSAKRWLESNGVNYWIV